DELAHRRAGLGHGLIADDQLIAEQADDNERIVVVKEPERFAQRLEIPQNDRVIRRIELRAAERRAKAAQEIVRELESNVGVRHFSRPSTSSACPSPLTPCPSPLTPCPSPLTPCPWPLAPRPRAPRTALTAFR